MTAWAFAALDSGAVEPRARSSTRVVVPGAAAAEALAAAAARCVGGGMGALSPMSLTNLLWAHANLHLPLAPPVLPFLAEEAGRKAKRGELNAAELSIILWVRTGDGNWALQQVGSNLGRGKVRGWLSGVGWGGVAWGRRWRHCSICQARARSSRSTPPSRTRW
jgi:hypothetical protein